MAAGIAEEGRLSDRILTTLHLADRRGYGMSLTHLSKMLIHGEAAEEDVSRELNGMLEVSNLDGIFCLKGREHLIPETRRRLLRNGIVGKRYEAEARRFAREYASLCPFIKCIAIAGSVASDGFSEEDDIDFNIFVEKGCKYTVYLLGILLSLRYSVRHRKKPLAKKSETPLLPKLICINVIWEQGEALPFSRRDKYLAYELLRQKPVFGLEFYNQVLESNRWLESYFPQIYRKHSSEVKINKSLLSKLLHLACSIPFASHIGERVCKEISYFLWKLVQFSRRKNPEAIERVKWVTDMQKPYALFDEPERYSSLLNVIKLR